ERAGGDGGDADVAVLPQPHDRALAELLLDLADGHLEGVVVAFHDGTLLVAMSMFMRSGEVPSGATYGGGVTATPDAVRASPERHACNLARTPVRCKRLAQSGPETRYRTGKRARGVYLAPPRPVLLRNSTTSSATHARPTGPDPSAATTGRRSAGALSRASVRWA